MTSTMLTTNLIHILRCPEDHTELTLADDDLVKRVNTAIREGRLQNRAGTHFEQPLDGGLVRADGRVMYPIIDGIPVLLQGDGIALDQLDN
jgi:uncharacterized protein YbaR (Trm112 family)